MVLSAKLYLGEFDFLDFVLHDCGTDDRLDVRLGDSKDLLVTSVVELAGKRGETLHEVDQRVESHQSTVPFLVK